jgi:hypothetical protein
MQKRDWMTQINKTINMGRIFVHSSVADNKSQLLFACDFFRRKNYDVVINIEPSESGSSILNVVVHPLPTCVDITLSRDDEIDKITEKIAPTTTKMRIRACGTVLDQLLKLTEWGLNNGWYVEKSMMNTLTFPTSVENNFQPKNTTLQIVLRRGLQPDTI